MTDHPTGPQRRTVLKTAAGLALAQAALGGAARAAEPPPARAGDFDFLAGNWKIKHRRLPSPGAAWDVFEGEATCWTILAGIASIEELRIPARKFSGMGLRLLDPEAHVWTDYWVNGRGGVLTPPGQTGRFQDGVGTFTADDMDGDKPIKVRGIWDNISPTTCRWRQAVSTDAGKTWAENWIMDWTRA